MKVFVCRICGDPYLGDESPDHCPFCGAERKFLVVSSVWKDEFDVELTDISRKNLETALKLEVSATEFYRCVENTVKNTEISKMFKSLRKVEAEHASLIKKFLKIDDNPEVEETCVDDVVASLEESNRREENAVKLYKQFAGEATEPRIKEIFEALAKVEEGHIVIDNIMIEKYSTTA
jgi:rubrerythrin